MEISLKAFKHDPTKPYNESESTLRILRGETASGELKVEKGNTFSFNGAGFS